MSGNSDKIRTMLTNNSISSSAKGVLSFLVLYGNKYKFTVSDLQEKFTDSTSRLEESLKELEVAGCVEGVEDGGGDPGSPSTWKLSIGTPADAVKKKNNKKTKKKEKHTKERKKKKNTKRKNTLSRHVDVSKHSKHSKHNTRHVDIYSELESLLSKSELEKLSFVDVSYLQSLDSPTIARITKVFTFWKRHVSKRREFVLGDSRVDKVTLTHRRARCVKRRFDDGYTVDELKKAIVGMCSNEYNVRKGYDDLQLACRSQQKVDQYIRWAEDGPPNRQQQSYQGGGRRETRISDPKKAKISPEDFLS